MNKKFLMTALAGLLTVCGFAASTDVAEKGSEELRPDKAIRILAAVSPDYKLAQDLEETQVQSAGKTPGYKVNDGGFVSIAEATKVLSTTKDNVDIVLLGSFSKNDKVELGYKDSSDVFHPSSIVLTSDSGYFTGYNAESFYQLDFSARPFDGTIEVAIVGEPLPGSTVTLILSLAALAVFMGYARRKQQRAAVQES